MAAILGIVASLVAPSIELGKCIVAPMKKQFNYLFCFNNNIQSLNDEAGKLDNVRIGVQMKVDEAKRNVEVIFPEVETWLTSIQNDQAKIDEINTKVQGGVVNLKSRYSLSRKAKKMAEVTKEVRHGGRFEKVSSPPPPPSMGMGSVPSSATVELESRKQVEEKVMAALRNKSVNMIGICGMGGVGKTTMAKRIMKRVRKENMFDEVVMAVVSQQADISKIQQQIADNLGLNLGVETLSVRAQKLKARINGTKRIFIVLDDVWKYLNLEDLGIPCEGGFERCKILLTSRDQGVLKEMVDHELIDIRVLFEEEAWFLFRGKAGDCVNHEDLHSIAQDVAKKCNGLPVALLTVGRALKDKKISIWEDALLQLKQFNPTGIPDVLEHVYQPLKLSYDFLEGEDAKSLFLLCSMFKEDFNIPLECLTQYVLGLRISYGISNLKEARNRVSALVDTLKSRSLLEDGYNEHYVKMHDVVRDMASFAASSEGRGIVTYLNDRSMDLPRKESFNWISMISKETSELPKELHFPNLHLLMIENMESSDMVSLDNFFEGMETLNVVSFENIQISSLPQSTNLLKNLRTLRLNNCQTLATLAVVGDLASLEILSCCNNEQIQELPADIGKLSQLRLLELYNCKNLRSIAPGVISKLIRLEELKIRGSFNEWEGKETGERRRNASLTELECLQRLRWLDIEITDVSLATMDTCLSSNIVRYDIKIIPDWSLMHQVYQYEDFQTKVYLRLPSENHLGNWIRTFLRSTERLELIGDGFNRWDLDELKNMKFHEIQNCSTMNKLVNDMDWRGDIFPVLKSLSLDYIPNIEEICSGPIPVESKLLGNFSVENVPFRNLRSIQISNCNKLRYLFPLSLARYLSQLESLEICRCEAMEEVFTNDEKDGQGDVAFPQLKELRFYSLPRLTTFCNGVECIEFSQIIHIDLSAVFQLRSFSSTKTRLNWAGHDDNFFHIFCHQKVFTLKTLSFKSDATNMWCPQIPTGFFKQLEEVIIHEVKVTSLFSSSMAANLVNLRELSVRSCRMMATLISDEEQVSENSVLFPSLKMLNLAHLSKLRSFCQWKHAIRLPSLNSIRIFDCPHMETFTMGSLSTENLEDIHMDGETIETKDLNAAVQEDHMKPQEKLHKMSKKKKKILMIHSCS